MADGKNRCYESEPEERRGGDAGRGRVHVMLIGFWFLNVEMGTTWKSSLPGPETARRELALQGQRMEARGSVGFERNCAALSTGPAFEGTLRQVKGAERGEVT